MDAVASRLSFGLDGGGSFMLFGYSFEVSFDLFEWHFNSQELLPVGMSVWVGPFYFGVRDATFHELEVTEKNSEITRLETVNRRLQGVTDRLQLQLSGCAVAAQGYGEILTPDEPGWSPAYDDVRLVSVKYRQALKLLDKVRPAPVKAAKRSHKKKVSPVSKTRKKK